MSSTVMIADCAGVVAGAAETNVRPRVADDLLTFPDTGLSLMTGP
jgi:hypothetical protein